MVLSVMLPFLLATAASAHCSHGYSCCSQWDFFIPILESCVEDEPSGADNCARNDQSKVPAWARLEQKKWWGGVCSSKTGVVTRAELEAREKKAHEFERNYTKWCGATNAANCSATEECFYKMQHLDGQGGHVWVSDLDTMDAVCVCTFLYAGDFARAKTDGTGDCVVCADGPNGTQPYVQKPAGGPQGPGAASFRNGEFACAFGPKKVVEKTYDVREIQV